MSIESAARKLVTRWKTAYANAINKGWAIKPDRNGTLKFSMAQEIEATFEKDGGSTKVFGEVFNKITIPNVAMAFKDAKIRLEGITQRVLEQFIFSYGNIDPMIVTNAMDVFKKAESDFYEAAKTMDKKGAPATTGTTTDTTTTGQTDIQRNNAAVMQQIRALMQTATTNAAREKVQQTVLKELDNPVSNKNYWNDGKNSIMAVIQALPDDQGSQHGVLHDIFVAISVALATYKQEKEIKPNDLGNGFSLKDLTDIYEDTWNKYLAAVSQSAMDPLGFLRAGLRDAAKSDERQQLLLNKFVRILDLTPEFVNRTNPDLIAKDFQTDTNWNGLPQNVPAATIALINFIYATKMNRKSTVSVETLLANYLMAWGSGGGGGGASSAPQVDVEARRQDAAILLQEIRSTLANDLAD